MRPLPIRAFALATLLLLATSLSARPPDWLKSAVEEDVTTIGRGHIAVRIYDSTDVRHLPDNRVKRIKRGAIRVLTDVGRQRALCMYHFTADTERVIGARAWVVAPDGRKIEEFSLRDFTDTTASFGKIFWPQDRVLSYRATTSIKIGGVFAWEFEVESQVGITDISYAFSTDMPSRFSEFEVTPLPGGRLEWHASSAQTPPPVAGSAPGSLRWERRGYVTTTTSGGNERPDGFIPASRAISVRALGPDGTAALQSWPDLARIAAGVIEPRIAVSPAIKAKAEALVAGKTTRWERVRAISEFLQKEVTYLLVILDQDYLAGYRPHAADEVLQNRYGDCKDKATLFLALLRAVGDDGHVVLVVAGNPKAVNPDWPAQRFNHAIAGLPADDQVPAGWPIIDAGALGRLVLFDPTDATTPLGVLPAADQGGFGLVASAKATGLVGLPMAPAELNRAETRVQATLEPSGDLIARVEEISSGGIGARFHSARENLRNDRFTPVLEKRLRETVSFLEGLHWTDTWDPGAARWQLGYDFKALRYARRTAGSLLLVNPQVVSARTRLTPWRTRTEGVVWRAASTERKLVRLTLPPGAVIEELPETAGFKTAFATGRLHYRREGQDVIYDYELTQKGGFLDQRAYESFRTALQKLDEAERRPVLVRLEAAK